MKKELYKTVLSNKGMLIMRLLISVALAFAGPLSLIAQANFIDTISAIMQSESDMNEIICSSVILLLSYMLPMANIMANHWQKKCDHSFELSWNRHINSLVKKIPYHLYEYEDTYNKIRQVAGNNLFSSIISYVLSSVTTVIGIVSYIVILVRISPVLMISVMILSPFVGWFSAKVAEKQYRRILALGTDRRRGIYKSSILRSEKYAKDIRINNCADYLVEDWKKTQKLTDASVLSVKFKYGFLGALILKTEYIVAFFNLAIVLFTFLNNKISPGVFISISNQILSVKIFENLKDLVTRHVNIKSCVDSYNRISEITENKTSKGLIEENGNVTIETRNLYFKYPHREDYVLKNINLKFEPGKSYAIVGENGAGKSTLIKLLIGLYPPNQGEILINGKNVTEISPDERRKLFGVSFQDYAKFGLTLKENILLNDDDGSRKSKEIMKCFDIDKIANSLADGYDTVLGKSFGNAVDLSGGQWQSVSVSRALAKEKDIYIFDEPTASLDPIREVDVFMKINETVRDHIRIFITHRLGITTKADKIIVLKNGEAAEQGSFKELTETDGYFKEMFDKQKSLYFGREEQ